MSVVFARPSVSVDCAASAFKLTVADGFALESVSEGIFEFVKLTEVLAAPFFKEKLSTAGFAALDTLTVSVLPD